VKRRKELQQLAQVAMRRKNHPQLERVAAHRGFPLRRAWNVTKAHVAIKHDEVGRRADEVRLHI